jgi:hypothetical protein
MVFGNDSTANWRPDPQPTPEATSAPEKRIGTLANGYPREAQISSERKLFIE